MEAGNIQGEWDPDRLVAVITAVGVPLDGALEDIVRNAKERSD